MARSIREVRILANILAESIRNASAKIATPTANNRPQEVPECVTGAITIRIVEDWADSFTPPFGLTGRSSTM